MHRLVHPLLALALVGCQALGTDDTRLKLRSGSVVILNEAVTIPEGRAHIKLQGGAVVGRVNEYEVNCEFRFRDLGPTRIEPSRFVVRRTGDGEEWFSPPYVRRFFKVLYLRSEQYPGVMTLECQVLDDPNPGRWIAVEDMALAVGRYFSFEP